ncbi:MAG: hypothetical protein AB7F99_00705 [Vicinamibacterales bacterium]
MLVLGLIPLHMFALVFAVYPAIGALIGWLLSFGVDDGDTKSKATRERYAATGVFIGLWGAASEAFGPQSPVLHILPGWHWYWGAVDEFLRTGYWPFQRYDAPMNPHVILGPLLLVSFVAGYFILPVALLVALPVALSGVPAAIRYARGRHPAESVIDAALKSGDPIDRDELARALAVDPNLLLDPPSEEISLQQRARAEALRQRLDADRALVEAVIEREKAKARAPQKSRFWS